MSKYTMLKPSEAQTVIDSFFPTQELADTFRALLEYISDLDPSIVCRYNNSIIGASQPDSHYHFYVSTSNGGNWIKFKHKMEKIPFTETELEQYKNYCNDAVALVSNNPDYK